MVDLGYQFLQEVAGESLQMHVRQPNPHVHPSRFTRALHEVRNLRKWSGQGSHIDCFPEPEINAVVWGLCPVRHHRQLRQWWESHLGGGIEGRQILHHIAVSHCLLCRPDLSDHSGQACLLKLSTGACNGGEDIGIACEAFRQRRTHPGPCIYCKLETHHSVLRSI
ncbi:hypothetical protein MUK42_14086 [Musa troglodytarum]|uniref:Uncharacterized protein n=1 Tax=Musa troglodytarum TaxID=320322 RepID=A0A9E7HUX5_9LILI|nr:hypothetical protein MUK42_14086 [Musa troglodytarum]